MGRIGLITACYGGLYGILTGLTKSADHPRRPLFCIVINVSTISAQTIYQSTVLELTLKPPLISLNSRPCWCILSSFTPQELWGGVGSQEGKFGPIRVYNYNGLRCPPWDSTPLSLGSFRRLGYTFI